ncbi:MAG: AraC family transcriptional regulator [Clostridia bacterium]|nr:AraC family transcriptional regulator [Clostridia bacterium]
MKKYFNYQINKIISVKNLITVEYLDTSSNFSYPEEVHDFYEFAYIDSGKIKCIMNGKETVLNQGDFMLIPRQTRHYYSAVKATPAAIFIVCFRSNSEILAVFDKKISLDKNSRVLVSDILSESKKAFSFPFERRLKLLDTPTFGAQQLVENNIERLLIHLTRDIINQSSDIKMVMNSVEFESTLVNDIIIILKKNVEARITLDDICRHTFYSKTFLNNVFKKNTGTSIMKYYTELKIQRAKELLRESASPSSVSNQLKFESPTYFTKVFKKHIGLTPSAYQKTIQ